MGTRLTEMQPKPSLRLYGEVFNFSSLFSISLISFTGILFPTADLEPLPSCVPWFTWIHLPFAL